LVIINLKQKNMKKFFLFSILFAIFIPINLFAQTTYFTVFFRSSTQIFEDNNISVSYSFVKGGQYSSDSKLSVKVKNKTSNMLYVDLNNTFIMRGDEAECYYVPSSTSVSNGKSVGGSVNLGEIGNAAGIGGSVGSALSGINVGGAKSKETTQTIYSQRVIGIAPMSAVILPTKNIFAINKAYLYHDVVTIKPWKYADDGIAVAMNHEALGIEKYTAKEYLYNNSPICFSFFVSYSTTEDCAVCSHLKNDFFANRIARRPTLSFGATMSVITSSSKMKEMENTNYFNKKDLKYFPDIQEWLNDMHFDLTAIK
jgi:hypothetical protein